MLVHSHLKNILIVCLELLDLAFFDTDCEAGSPDLRLNKRGKKKKNSKRLKYTMHINTGFTTLNIFLDFIILKLIVYSKLPLSKSYLFAPCDGFVHCCPLLKPP